MEKYFTFSKEEIARDHLLGEFLEELYWRFDALRAKGNKNERDIFKDIVGRLVNLAQSSPEMPRIEDQYTGK